MNVITREANQFGMIKTLLGRRCRFDKWEVDEFKGDNEGLIIAEIELNKADEDYLIPNWAIKNVSSDRNYANSNLTKKPFKTW